jgi:hypothetical protein
MNKAAERCTAAVAVDRSGLEPAGRSGDRHDLRTVDPRLRRQPT